jgi:fused signal recognition particle receptor
MGFLNKLFGKKEKESLDQGLQKTKEGFLTKLSKAWQEKVPLMKKCWII